RRLLTRAAHGSNAARDAREVLSTRSPERAHRGPVSSEDRRPTTRRATVSLYGRAVLVELPMRPNRPRPRPQVLHERGGVSMMLRRAAMKLIGALTLLVGVGSANEAKAGEVIKIGTLAPASSPW